MKIYLITSQNIDELKTHTNIVYVSKYTNLIGVETELTKNELMMIDGVLTVEEATTGSF